MNMYVSNLSEEVTGEDLKEAFAAFGQVASAVVIKDKFNGLSRGFGFVEMQSKAESETAMGTLNGKDLKGKAISVKQARPREDNRSGGGNSWKFGNNEGRRGNRW